MNTMQIKLSPARVRRYSVAALWLLGAAHAYAQSAPPQAPAVAGAAAEETAPASPAPTAEPSVVASPVATDTATDSPATDSSAADVAKAAADEPPATPAGAAATPSAAGDKPVPVAAAVATGGSKPNAAPVVSGARAVSRPHPQSHGTKALAEVDEVDVDGLSVGVAGGVAFPRHNRWKRLVQDDELPMLGAQLGYDLRLGSLMRLNVGGEFYVGTADGDYEGADLRLIQALLGARLLYILRDHHAPRVAMFAHLAGGVSQLALDWHSGDWRTQGAEADGMGLFGAFAVGIETRFGLSGLGVGFLGFSFEVGIQGGTRIKLEPDDATAEGDIPVRFGSFGEVGTSATFVRFAAFVGF